MANIIAISSILALVCCSAHGYSLTSEKSEVQFWDEFFIRRLLEEEHLMAKHAEPAVQAVADALPGILQFQKVQLRRTLQQCRAPGVRECLRNLRTLLFNWTNQEVSSFNSCTADFLPRLKSNNKSLERLTYDYKHSLSKALVGIDQCAEIYPTKRFSRRLSACVNLKKETYFKASEKIRDFLDPGLTMNVFNSVVVGCAADSAVHITGRGKELVQSMLKCGEDNGADLHLITKTLSRWKGYTNKTSLKEQINTCRKNYQQLETSVEEDLRSFYSLQNALDGVSPRNPRVYRSILDDSLTYHFTLLWTAYDNYPDDKDCTERARQMLDQAVFNGMKQYETFDKKLRRRAMSLKLEMETELTSINRVLPSLGDPAILVCFEKGYIFRENAISKCIDLLHLNYTNSRENFVRGSSQLRDYIDQLTNNTFLENQVSILSRVSVGADQAADELKQCLNRKYNSGLELSKNEEDKT